MPFDSAPITSLVIEALREGRARVERGWCQEILAEGNTVCALGGVSLALRSRGRPCRYYQATRFLCMALGVKYETDVMSWNDAPERTQADVLALYDKAIELAVEEALRG